VGSRSGSLSEVVEEGRTGLLAPPLDSVGLAEAIDTLSRDVPRRREMAAHGLARVRRHFSVEMAVMKTMDVYESLWNDSFLPDRS